MLPSTLHATGYLRFAPDANGDECVISDPGLHNLVTVYVLAKGFDGVTGFHFVAPVPPSSGLQHVADQSPYYLFGNSQTGVDVAIGSCQTAASIVVMTMQFYEATAGDACTFYGAQPGALRSDCYFTDLPTYVVGVMLNSDGTCTEAKHLAPADGATNVPLTTSLSWTPGYSCYLQGGPLIFFGTAPNPPQVACCATSPYVVGPLQPGTKYYWKIADPGAGSVWSFTTTNSVAVKPSTWGAIKALYR